MEPILQPSDAAPQVARRLFYGCIVAQSNEGVKMFLGHRSAASKEECLGLLIKACGDQYPGSSIVGHLCNEVSADEIGALFALNTSTTT